MKRRRKQAPTSPTETLRKMTQEELDGLDALFAKDTYWKHGRKKGHSFDMGFYEQMGMGHWTVARNGKKSWISARWEARNDV